jgi:hypothetical protein
MQEKREKLSRKVCMPFASAGVALQPIPATPRSPPIIKLLTHLPISITGACLGLTSIEVGGTVGWAYYIWSCGLTQCR